MILWEQVPGTRYRVAHCADPVYIGVAEAVPPYASAELAEAMDGAFAANVERHCRHCEALTPPVPGQEGDRVSLALTALLHAPECPWSDEAIAALHEACRPPGPLPELSDAEAGRVCDYLRALLSSLEAQAPDDAGGG